MNLRRLTSFLPLLVLCGLMIALWAGLQNVGNKQGNFSGHIGEDAPRLQLPLLNNDGVLDTKDWYGRAYAVNFFASWCVPCVAEQPNLFEMANSFGIPIIGIAYKDKPQSLRRFLDRHSNPFMQIAIDRDGLGAIDWGMTGVPETYLISASGKICFHHIGVLTNKDVKKKLLPAWRGQCGGVNE